MSTLSDRRRLVVDLAATSRNWALPDWGERAIAEVTPSDWEVIFVRAPAVPGDGGSATASDEARSAIATAEAYFGFGISPALLTSAPSLRWIQSAAAGVGALRFPELMTRDIVVTNSAGVHAVPIAEHVIGGVIYLLRGFDIAVDQHRRGEWNKAPFTADSGLVREVGECLVLIVGTGGIGTAVAERFSALGATVVGVRRRPSLGVPSGFSRIVSLDAIDDELPRADVVVLAAPLTDETRGLLHAERLDRLPSHAIVVNVGRGQLSDESALAERLGARRLRGAVLDVFDSEPLWPESPLWGLRQVLLTPHVSAVSPRRFWQRELDLFFDNWARYRAGQPLRNVVDLNAGY